jgi:hypothetical protein
MSFNPDAKARKSLWKLYAKRSTNHVPHLTQVGCELYKLSHGKNPRGWGYWIFELKVISYFIREGEKSTSVIRHAVPSSSYGDAKKSVLKFARELERQRELEEDYLPRAHNPSRIVCSVDVIVLP